MSRALVVVVAGAFVASVVVAMSSSACQDYGEVGGNEQDAGPVMGDRGGNCFPDGQCKTGLVCVENTICLMPGTTFDGASLPGVDAGGGDGSGDGAAILDGETCALVVPPEENGIRCGNVKCTPSQICCSTGANIAKCVQVAECDPDFLIRCDSNADCPTNESCCVTGKTRATACPSISISSTRCAALCGALEISTCAPGFPSCGAGNCRALQAHFDDATPMAVLGLCL